MSLADEKSEKDLFRVSLELLVLAALGDGRQYGYAIRKQLHQFTGQTVPYAALYPLLHRLAERGLVNATPDPGSPRKRKWYALTSAGEKALIRSAARWQATLARHQALVLPAVRRVAAKR